MNYEIPDNEKENVLSVFWQMLREIEDNTDPKHDVLNANLVMGGYAVLNRIGAAQARPAWEQPPGTAWPTRPGWPQPPPPHTGRTASETLATVPLVCPVCGKPPVRPQALPGT